jgi:hypothetical protein
LPVTVAGSLHVMVLVADNLTSPSSTLDTVWVVLGWALWSLFVLEFVARLIVAPSTWRFLRGNWWQLVFLAVPFLRSSVRSAAAPGSPGPRPRPSEALARPAAPLPATCSSWRRRLTPASPTTQIGNVASPTGCRCGVVGSPRFGTRRELGRVNERADVLAYR